MKRRSFLTLLGLSPVVAKAAPSAPPLDTQSDWRLMGDCPISKGDDALRAIMQNLYFPPPRTREGNGG